MGTFFDISLQTLNLFSFMMGVSFVALSSMWGGRLRATRLVFFYLVGLLVWVGVIKPGESEFKKGYNSTRTPSASSENFYEINPRTHTPQPRKTP